MNYLQNIGVIVLAAGKGTRLNCIDKPKVMLEIGGKPIVSYIVETSLEIGFTKEKIVLVVGFQKEKVKEYFGDTVTFADQEEQLGTAHAAYVGMKNFPSSIEQVLIMGGDDSAFYTEKTLQDFVEKHLESGSILSLLTADVENPSGLGRVVHDTNNNFVDVLEKEELSEEQKEIKEISTGTFCLDRKWFESIFSKMKKIPGLEEYGLPQAIEIAHEEGKKMQAIKLKNSREWFGINTLEELEQANNLKK